jgi:hypothetical protein
MSGPQAGSSVMLGLWMTTSTSLASATQAYEPQPLLLYKVCMASRPDCPDADTFSCSAYAHVRATLNV